MENRFYTSKDYQSLIQLYKNSSEFEFDEITDSLEALERKINKDSQSILVAYDNHELVGSVSIIEDGRIAILFRLVATDNDTTITTQLIARAENLLVEKGFEEVHSIAPIDNQAAEEIREKSKFTKGNTYHWFWKKINI